MDVDAKKKNVDCIELVYFVEVWSRLNINHIHFNIHILLHICNVNKLYI